jgi:hypothetical protein
VALETARTFGDRDARVMLTAGIGQFGAIQPVAPCVGLEETPVNVRATDEIERAVADTS